MGDRYVEHDGPNQYGPRKGTLGLAIHMTEGSGGDGDLAYLLRDPARGVSANFFAHEDGTIHQLMPLNQASGSMNPRDRQKVTNTYYGMQNLVAALGTHWSDPNAWSISIEIGGKRAVGPNARQVKAVTAWGLDMRARYPTLAGAFGHADQTNTKGCPGVTPAIQNIFTAIGGHGAFTEPQEDNMAIPVDPDGLWAYEVDIPKGTQLFDTSFQKLTLLGADATVKGGPLTANNFLGVEITTGGVLQLVFVRPLAVTYRPVTSTPATPANYPVTVGGKPAGEVTLP